MRGLLGRSSLAPDEGMLFRPAGSIQMFFMRFPIDAVFCDGDLVVVGDDPRAPHQDERNRGMSYSEKIKDVIEGSEVAIFMKGTPQLVMCGNSDRALRALRRAGAPVTAVDVLPDPQIRQELSALSGWPTIPQVFVKGELVGGADIVEELEQSGELGQTLTQKLGEDFASRAGDKTVALG